MTAHLVDACDAFKFRYDLSYILATYSYLFLINQCYEKEVHHNCSEEKSDTFSIDIAERRLPPPYCNGAETVVGNS